MTSTREHKLLTARSEILSRLSPRTTEERERAPDVLDEAAIAAAEAVTDAERGRMVKRLHRISDALGRLHSKKYGICVECGGRIGAKRLRALPEADLCLRCAEEEEG